MKEVKTKTFYDSEAVLAEILLPYQANTSGNIHGGEIMKIMDSTAGVAGMKYSGGNVVTARVDELQFKQPVHIGDHVKCTGHVVYTGRTSMEVFVTVEVEDLKTGHVSIALTAFFTMVAVDDNGRPVPVAPIEFSNEPFLRSLYFEGQRRYESHRHRSKRKREENG
jgi:acyl-CoA hydrolase